MCNECFELFDYSIREHQSCPRHDCEGTIVEIDTEIAWPISAINKELKRQRIPARTNFCCSGHLPNSVHPYVGFEFSEYHLSDEIAPFYMSDFISEILDPCVRTINSRLKEAQNFITLKHPFESKYEVLPEDPRREYQPYYSRYRLFVNDLDFRYERSLHTELDRCFAVNFIQMVFKDFLLDCIASIRTVPKPLKLGSWCK